MIGQSKQTDDCSVKLQLSRSQRRNDDRMTKSTPFFAEKSPTASKRASPKNAWTLGSVTTNGDELVFLRESLQFQALEMDLLRHVI